MILLFFTLILKHAFPKTHDLDSYRHSHAYVFAFSSPRSTRTLFLLLLKEEKDAIQCLLVSVDQEPAGIVPLIQRSRRSGSRLVVGQLAAFGCGLEVETAAPEGAEDGVTRARVPLVRGVLLRDVVDGPAFRHAEHFVSRAWKRTPNVSKQLRVIVRSLTHGGEGLVFRLQLAYELLSLGLAHHDEFVLVPGGHGIKPQGGRVIPLALVHACAPVDLTAPPE